MFNFNLSVKIYRSIDYNKKYHMVLVIRFLDKVILKKSAKYEK